MAGRGDSAQSEPGFTLPVLERIVPPPPMDLVAALIESRTAPDDIVADLFGRGGWVARSAIDRRRLALSLETGPLSRLLAEVVLRPPDLRHLDASFGALGAAPHGESSLRVWIGDMYSTRCATCERILVADEIGWSRPHLPDHPPSEGLVDEEPREGRTAAAPGTPTEKRYRCTVCRDQRGGGEQRRAPLDPADVERAHQDVGADASRRILRDRFPVPHGAEDLVDDILAIHSDRQLVGLAAILERVEGELRAAPIVSALRLAFIGAVLPASRLNVQPGRPAQFRIVSGRVRDPLPESWRERNPWVAFEESYRLVRGFVQRIEGAALGPIQARLGEDLRSLVETTASVVVRIASPSTLRALAREQAVAPRGAGPDDDTGRSRVRLVLGQPPPRPTPERLAATFHLTAWGLGREAAAMIPMDSLVGSAIRVPWSWQAATVRRALEAIEPHLARDGRAILLLEESGAEALIAATLAGVGAGFRLDDARLAAADEEAGSRVVLIPPGGVIPPGPRTRANRVLPAVPGGSGDPDLVPGRGLFAPPERFDARPFSVTELQRAVTETLVEILKARGEPAPTERLFGEILIGLDRAGLLRRYALSASPVGDPDAETDVARRDAPAPSTPSTPSTASSPASPVEDVRDPLRGRPAAGLRSAARHDDPPELDPVERLVALIREELSRSTNRRIEEIETGRWWLADREDRAAAAAPLADRLEWAAYSLLSTAGPLPESAFFERISTMFRGHDLPDEALVRACLESYRSRTSTPDAIRTDEDLRVRTQEHTELLVHLADGGHRLGMEVWLARAEQTRPVGSRTLGDWLDEREQRAYLPGIQRARVADLEAVDCIWYVRHRAAFLWEVEWTAMLNETIVRRHGRIPPTDDQVRLVVVPPERTALIRAKLERSPVLRAAMAEGNWHIIQSSHLRSWLRSEPLELATLEPFLGLDAMADRAGDQLPLFDAPDALR